MDIQLDDEDLRRLEDLAKREGKPASELAIEIFHEALSARERNGTWVEDVCGSLEGDPEFEKVVELGKEVRETDRPVSEN